MSGFTYHTIVKKQGGTAHDAVSRSGPRPTLAPIRPWASSVEIGRLGRFFFEEEHS
ncbi:MAG TPA: hypothetical protein VFK47_09665 [Ktedonobacteraceae bacterium]|nr:hypothetical protein [Ktedonobacteraceae bacterium]